MRRPRSWFMHGWINPSSPPPNCPGTIKSCWCPLTLLLFPLALCCEHGKLPSSTRRCAQWTSCTVWIRNLRRKTSLSIKEDEQLAMQQRGKILNSSFTKKGKLNWKAPNDKKKWLCLINYVRMLKHPRFNLCWTAVSISVFSPALTRGNHF